MEVERVAQDHDQHTDRVQKAVEQYWQQRILRERLEQVGVPVMA